jgi:hypothetical protein
MLRNISVPFRHELLDRNGALDSGHNGGKLQEDAVARGLNDAAAMARHHWIDCCTVFTERPCGADLVGAHEPAITDYVGGQYGGQSAFDAILLWSDHGGAFCAGSLHRTAAAVDDSPGPLLAACLTRVSWARRLEFRRGSWEVGFWRHEATA